MPRKKPNITPAERELFRKTMEDARPLKHDTAPIEPPKKRAKKYRHSEDSTVTPEDSGHYLDKIGPDDWLGGETLIHFARNGIPHRLQNQLRRGQMGIQARLDLHRMTSNEALFATKSFLHSAVLQNKKCVLIVHGKGGQPGKAILKNLLNLWLRDQPEVLAFFSAKPRHGGNGALYVLLKSRKNYEE